MISILVSFLQPGDNKTIFNKPDDISVTGSKSSATLNFRKRISLDDLVAS